MERNGPWSGTQRESGCLRRADAGRLHRGGGLRRHGRHAGGTDGQRHSAGQLEQAAGYAVALSNDAVREYGLAHPGFERMGTTLVSAVVRDDLALVSNVGDSRAYHITREGIRQVSRDHSVVEDMVEKGDLTRDEARHHPRRNLITRALGTEPGVAADAFPLKWQQGDFLLLCSDGLINTVSDQELLFEVIHSEPLDTCLDRLLALSRQRGAPDNVTAVLLMNI